jgi:chromosome segregation ATPase
MLEHALADKEEDMAEQASDNLEKRSEEEAQWETNRREMQGHIDELSTAIQEKVQAMQDLETQKEALLEGYEERLAAKEAAIDEATKEHEAIQDALKKEIDDLRSLVKNQKATGDQKNKEHEDALAQREQALRADADRRIKEKEAEISQLKDDASSQRKEMEERAAEIEQLRVQLANQQEHEERLKEKIEQL